MNPLKKKFLPAALCLASAASLIFSPVSGIVSVGAENMMTGIEPKGPNAEVQIDLPSAAAAATDFSVELFKKSLKESENTIISPISVLYALAMTANGAKGETLSQMEAVLGMSVTGLNEFLSAYKEILGSDDANKVNLANSIWFKDDPTFTVNQDFLQTNADYYGASIYKEVFDSETPSLINKWVEEETLGMIDEIINELPNETVMCLVNALAFDGQWETPYEEFQVEDGTFTTENAQERTAKMMYSDEKMYLEDENAIGFLKYYKNRKYAFAALLPDEGVSVADYAAALTGEKLLNILANAQKSAVSASMPAFTSDFSVEMKDILKDMGMEIPFDGDLADFTGLGTSTEGNICISKVLHKTHISVDEKGTEAAASTAVVMVAETALLPDKEVYLDRPFVYAIVDCETNLPIFIGTLMDTEA